MVDQGGNIYLADFGITRHAGSSLTNYGVIGTPAYMAPEQLLGQTVSSATDVYALGVLLYELVTGQKPFRGDHPSSAQAGESITDRLRFEHLRLVPPDPTAYQHDLPPQVADVMLKTLEKNPTLRYDDVMHLFEDFCHACGVFPESVPDRISLEGMPPPQVVQKTGATEVEPNIAQPRNIPAVQSPTFAPESGLWDHPLRRNTVVIGAPPEKKQTNRWLIGCLGLATLAGITGIIGIGIFILLSPTGFDFILFRKTTATPTTAPPEPSLTASRPTNAIMPTTTFTARPAPARPTDTPFPIQPSQTRSPTVRTPPTPTPLSKSMIEVFNQGASVKGEPLLWKRIGVGSKTLVIIGNIHGSEINTGDLVQKLSEQVDWWMKAVGQEKQIYFFPRMNPDGVGVNDYLNANGVDLNRNWQTSNWQSAATGNYGKNMPGKGGSAPFSEPETNATKNFLLRLQASSQTPLIVISYHSATAPGVVQPSYTITSAGQVNDRQATLLAKDIALWLNYQYIDRWTAYQITGELIHWCGEQGIVCVDIELPNKNMVDAAALALHKEMISNLLNTRWR
jgi:serine/threonine protein kinase